MSNHSTDEIIHEEQQTPKMTVKAKHSKLFAPETKLERQTSFQANSPRSQYIFGKSSSAMCLCSPTTHAGSFRCRYHRTLPAGMPRTGSVGSNLALLAGDKADHSIPETKLF